MQIIRLMITLSLLTALSRGLWLMDENSAMAYEPIVNQLINGHPVQFQNPSEGKIVGVEPKAVILTGGLIDPTFSPLSQATPGSIAVMPLCGPVMKEDWCGQPGMLTLEQWMKEADQNRNIIGQILYTDSPGGSAVGVDAFSKSIKNLNKPVVGFVDTSAYSGGYWIVSATKEIILSEELAGVGSIGAFSTFYDSSKRDKKMGYRKIEVYAPQSTKKNKIYRDIKAGDLQEYQDRFLKPLVDQFQATVKQNRFGSVSKMTEDVFAGDIFTAKEAITVGLADSIGNFNFAINRVMALSKKQAA